MGITVPITAGKVDERGATTRLHQRELTRLNKRVAELEVEVTYYKAALYETELYQPAETIARLRAFTSERALAAEEFHYGRRPAPKGK